LENPTAAPLRRLQRYGKWRIHDSRRPSRKTDSSYIKHRLADPIDPQVVLDQRILQRGSAKWRQAEPSHHETKRLAQMSGIE
jgi:hypothetical protein